MEREIHANASTKSTIAREMDHLTAVWNDRNKDNFVALSQ